MRLTACPSQSSHPFGGVAEPKAVMLPVGIEFPPATVARAEVTSFTVARDTVLYWPASLTSGTSSIEPYAS